MSYLSSPPVTLAAHLARSLPCATASASQFLEHSKLIRWSHSHRQFLLRVADDPSMIPPYQTWPTIYNATTLSSLTVKAAAWRIWEAASPAAAAASSSSSSSSSASSSSVRLVGVWCKNRWLTVNYHLPKYGISMQKLSRQVYAQMKLDSLESQSDLDAFNCYASDGRSITAFHCPALEKMTLKEIEAHGNNGMAQHVTAVAARPSAIPPAAASVLPVVPVVAAPSSLSSLVAATSSSTQGGAAAAAASSSSASSSVPLKPSIPPLEKYPAELFVALDEEHVCGCCTDVPFEPPNLPCGHLFCRSCLVDWSNKGKLTCPTCLEPFKLADLDTVNALARRKIGAMKAYCRHRELGCTAEFTIGVHRRGLEEHEEKCEFTEVQCLQCKKKILKRQQEVHQKNECEERQRELNGASAEFRSRSLLSTSSSSSSFSSSGVIACTFCDGLYHANFLYSRHHHRSGNYNVGTFLVPYPPCRAFCLCPFNCDAGEHHGHFLQRELAFHLPHCGEVLIECDGKLCAIRKPHQIKRNNYKNHLVQDEELLDILLKHANMMTAEMEAAMKKQNLPDIAAAASSGADELTLNIEPATHRSLPPAVSSSSSSQSSNVLNESENRQLELFRSSLEVGQQIEHRTWRGSVRGVIHHIFYDAAQVEMTLPHGSSQSVPVSSLYPIANPFVTSLTSASSSSAAAATSRKRPFDEDEEEEQRAVKKQLHRKRTKIDHVMSQKIERRVTRSCRNKN